MIDEEKITMDDARALVSDQALWPFVRDFLWNFAPQVHPSWLEGLGGETLDGGRENETAAPHASRLMPSPRVRRFVLSSLGIVPCFHVFPKDDWSRLLLLDGKTLEALVKWLGALVCADDLRRVTAGAAVRELKAAFPGIYPEVFGFTAYFSGMKNFRKDAEAQKEERPDVGGGSSIVERVVSVGSSIVDSLLDDAPPALVSRLRFKLPKDLCSAASMRLEKGTSRAVVAKLLKLKFPEAYKLCC